MSTNKRDGEEVERGDALKLLIGTYWQIAYNEGRQGRTTDTPEGDAQRTWSQIEALIDAQERALAESREQRDHLVAEYERAVGCGPQGYLHAAMHLFNAITNAQVDQNAKTIVALQARAERLAGTLREIAALPTTHAGPGWIAVTKARDVLEQDQAP